MKADPVKELAARTKLIQKLDEVRDAYYGCSLTDRDASVLGFLIDQADRLARLARDKAKLEVDARK